jgi:site-specific recombinase XerD
MLIRLEHMDFTAHQIYIARAKRKNFGCWYSLSIEKQRLLNDWLKVRKTLPYADQLPELFISSRGRGLDDQSIYWTFKKYAVAASLDAHPHQLRHTCAVNLVKGGAPIQDVKNRLGHSQITSTEIYIQLAGPDRVERDCRLNSILEGK